MADAGPKKQQYILKSAAVEPEKTKKALNAANKQLKNQIESKKN